MICCLNSLSNQNPIGHTHTHTLLLLFAFSVWLATRWRLNNVFNCYVFGNAIFKLSVPLHISHGWQRADSCSLFSFSSSSTFSSFSFILRVVSSAYAKHKHNRMRDESNIERTNQNKRKTSCADKWLRDFGRLPPPHCLPLTLPLPFADACYAHFDFPPHRDARDALLIARPGACDAIVSWRSATAAAAAASFQLNPHMSLSTATTTTTRGSQSDSIKMHT